MESTALVLRDRGIAPVPAPVLAARVIAALSLLLLVVAVRAQNADELLARVAGQGDAKGPSAGELQFRAELDRARAELLPDVRLRQNSHWNYSGLPDLSLGVSATVPLEEPRRRARRDLALKGLELAQHNAAAERRRELYQLRRSLRMLAHLEEMEALLEEHHAALLERSPELASLEGIESNGGRGDPEAVIDDEVNLAPGDDVIGYLEVDMALRRTRGERRLLSQAIERRHPSALTISEIGTGRPSLPPLPELDEHSGFCRVETDETRRARLVHEEEGLAIEREAAADDLRVTLDLNADARYVAASVGRPWQLGAGVGVNVVLPAGAGPNPSLSLSVSPSSLSQGSSLRWPGREPNRTGQLHETEREDAYQESIREAELSARQAQLSFEDSRRRLRLRRIALASLDSEQAAAGQAGRRIAGSDQEILQARADLLGAELERDLAHMELARACGSDEQAGWSATP